MTDYKADRQKDRHTDRQKTNTQIDRHTDGQLERQRENL